MTTTEMLSPLQAAKWVGVSRNTIYTWINEGYLKAYRYGPRTIRIDAADLAALGDRGAK